MARLIKAFLTMAISIFSISLFATTYSVKSPDGRLEAKVNIKNVVSFSILSNGKSVLENAEIAMSTDKGDFGKGAKATSVLTSSKDEILKPAFGVMSSIRDNYNQIEIDFKTHKLIFRAYDEAIAYRFVSNVTGGEIKVFSEDLNLSTSPETLVITQYAKRGVLYSYEQFFERAKMKDVDTKREIVLPTLIQNGDVKIAIVESDVQAYPMLRFEKSGDGLKSTFYKYPKSFKPHTWGMIKYGEFENYIAKADGNRAFPWRAFIVAHSDAELSVNTTVYKLAEASRIDDTSWISTGLCAWDWWVNWKLDGVDFKTGVNLQTYYKYIDFAAKYNVPFIAVDAGWLVGRGVEPANIHEALIEGNPYLDVKALIEYAHKKDVKVILWCFGQSLNLYAEKAIPLMKSWGADGLKVDFIARDDQTAMELYYRIARVAAENKMLVDLHGCAKPAGLERTYPNVVNFEAVRGLEMNKFKMPKPITASHDVDIVMTRMLQGPMDYTPGAMRNVEEKFYAHNYTNPVSATTRAHQGALYVLFYAPLQMLSDSPSDYEASPEFTSYISKIPTTWDESKPIEAKLGEYVVLARRSGDVWYVSGICDKNGKDVEIDLAKILPSGSYKVEILSDSVNSDKSPEDFKIEKKFVSTDEKLKVSMCQNGGFVARFTRSNFAWFSKLFE